MPGVPRSAMELDKWLRALEALRSEALAELARFIAEECATGDIVLFGSRARGTHHALSDWDIAVVVAEGRYGLETRGFGQVLRIPLSALDEVLGTSMLILDVAADGVLLCGTGDHWAELKRRVAQYVEERGLERSPSGWYPRTTKHR